MAKLTLDDLRKIDNADTRYFTMWENTLWIWKDLRTTHDIWYVQYGTTGGVYEFKSREEALVHFNELVDKLAPDLAFGVLTRGEADDCRPED